MLERLIQLEINIAELEKFRLKYTVDQVKNDRQVEWILRYGLFESIQIVIDICCHLTAKYNLGNAQTYSDCILLLKKENYLSGEVAENLLGMTGLRNILIHEYVTVEVSKLFALLEHLDDFGKFADEIKDVI